jgi:hypothetical protein
MVSMPDKVQVATSFEARFMGTDQDVRDLDAPKPETKWCLVELPQKDIDTLCNGSTFFFQSHEGGVGLDDGGAALSTDTQTFSIEFLENSNSLFLAQVFEDEASGATEAPPAGEAAAEAAVAPKSYRCEVFGQVRGQMLTKEGPVNKQRLATLLSQQILGAELKEPVVTGDALAYEMASSPAELQALLREGPYVEVDGLWRFVPASLEREILDVAVNVVVAKGWDHQDLDRTALLKEVQQHLGASTVPAWSVLEKALKFLRAEPPAPADNKEKEVPAPTKDSAKGASAADAFGLDKGKMTRFQALQLLRTSPQQVRDRFGFVAPPPQPKRPRHGTGGAGAFRDTSAGAALEVEEFASAFQELSGAAEKLSTDELMKLLGDEAYLDEFESSLHPLDVFSLPLDPKERLKRLFEMQSHWNDGRLAGFITPTLPVGIKVEPWLLKHTRQVFVELTPGKEVRFLTKKFAM